jgi:hypothetical protein
VGSVENRRKRLEELERRFGGRENVVQINVTQVDGHDGGEPLYSLLMTPSGQQFGESFKRDFERSLEYAKSRVEAGTISRAELEGAVPITLAAVYAVLASRDDPRAEEVRKLYEEERGRRRHHHTHKELEEWAPGVGDEFDRYFWEIVERHAQSREDGF